MRQSTESILAVINHALPQSCEVSVNGGLVKVAEVSKAGARDIIEGLSLVPEQGTKIECGFSEWYHDANETIIFHYSPILQRIMIG